MGKLSLFCLLAAVITVSVTAQKDPHYVDGRTTMVHLFEWRWEDVALECERFLGPYGFGGIQVSPPSENKIVTDPYRPWYERYQPISYKLETRSGNEQQFQDMVRRCNAAGVRIIVDAVFNHMTGGGVSQGTGGSTSNGYDYPAVPYGPTDFNCPQGKCSTGSCFIESYNDPEQVRNCELVDLDDLDLGKSYVREKITEYLNRLISYGVAGFRVDASKHMWPGDLQAIISGLNNLATEHGFPAGTRPFVTQEVIDLGGEAISSSEYLAIGRVTEFKYGRDIGNIFRKWEGQKLAYAENFGEGWGMLKDGDSFIFIDNHDNQRGHGAGGASILTYHVSKLYKMATAFLLAYPYGSARIMSSFEFDAAIDWQGPPHDDNMNTLPVTINPDNTCGNGWVCEHRWRQIYNMVNFRNVAGSAPMTNWWTNGENQIAFSREGKAFIAINNDDFALNSSLQTSLPAGTYCDIISGNLENGSCTGKSVVVNGDGTANLSISNQDEDPFVAIHVGARV